MRWTDRPEHLAAIVLLLLSLFACAGDSPFDGGAAYVAEVEQFRSDREEGLQAPKGWLSLVGLHWLEEGESRLGSDPANEVVLPEGAAPLLAGTLTYDGYEVRIRPVAGAGLVFDGQPLRQERALRDDSAGPPDLVGVGRLGVHVIARGGRHALRVKDPQSPTRLGFDGLDWFPVDPACRVEARLRAYDSPRAREVETVAGGPAEMLAPGRLEFELGGHRLSLEPFVDKPGGSGLFIIFKDRTSGGETYGAGRFLAASMEGDRVVLDFNRAYNPPCAYTAHATCPLPPSGNRLDVEVRAGERFAGTHYD